MCNIVWNLYAGLLIIEVYRYKINTSNVIKKLNFIMIALRTHDFHTNKYTLLHKREQQISFLFKDGSFTREQSVGTSGCCGNL